MKGTSGHKAGGVLLLLPLLFLYVATKVSGHQSIYHLLVILAPASAAIGGILWIASTIRSGVSFGTHRYHVQRSHHRGRFYVSLATAILLVIVWLSFMVVAAISGLSRTAA
ncbi:hypothetical protein LDO32_16710 [Luteimonas sp. Y-2-2-4F]|nr:hypothetical protein [Luteimonas sp. Y-2-2-4F]MCD9033358.1 hypothetical protein [Luteimonas sp. Y-2-2-4F]